MQRPGQQRARGRAAQYALQTQQVAGGIEAFGVANAIGSTNKSSPPFLCLARTKPS
jgi:hypothetical protein